MLCNCGVRACLPVKIRNAKSFPVFKSKGKILTSDTGFPSFNYCGGTLEVPLKDSLKNARVPVRVCSILHQHQRLQKMILALSFANSSGYFASAMPIRVLGISSGNRVYWMLCRNGRASAEREAGGIWHMLKSKETSF